MKSSAAGMKEFLVYETLFLLILTIVCILISIVYHKRLGEIKFLIIIPICGLIQMTITEYFLYFLEKNKAHDLVRLSRNIYVIIEMITILYFFYLKINSKRIKTFIVFLIWSVIVLSFSFSLISNDPISSRYSTFASIEAILILTFCILLFVQFINESNTGKLLGSYTFQLTSGIFFLFSFTAPYYFVYDYLEKSQIPIVKKLEVINQFAYIIFYLTLIMAYICKIRTTRLLAY
jgi:hypothetical protein